MHPRSGIPTSGFVLSVAVCCKVQSAWNCLPRYLRIQRMKSVKLYVGNLPSNTSAKDLEDLFAPYGVVTSARVLTTKHSGHPRGYGYVEMLRQHAELAMAELHGQRINFMILSVTEANS